MTTLFYTHVSTKVPMPCVPSPLPPKCPRKIQMTKAKYIYGLKIDPTTRFSKIDNMSTPPYQGILGGRSGNSLGGLPNLENVSKASSTSFPDRQNCHQLLALASSSSPLPSFSLWHSLHKYLSPISTRPGDPMLNPPAVGNWNSCT